MDIGKEFSIRLKLSFWTGQNSFENLSVSYLENEFLELKIKKIFKITSEKQKNKYKKYLLDYLKSEFVNLEIKEIKEEVINKTKMCFLFEIKVHYNDVINLSIKFN